MELTKELIEERKKLLRAQMDKLSADLNAVGGALQDCDYWLNQVIENTHEDTPTK